MSVVARSVDELSLTFSCEIGDSAIKPTRHREARYGAEVDLFVLVMHVRSGDDPLLGTVSGRTAGLHHLVVQLDKNDAHEDHRQRYCMDRHFSVQVRKPLELRTETHTV